MIPQPFEVAVEGDIVLRGQRWPGRNQTIILVHEPGEHNDLDCWRPLIPYLLALELTVLTVDLRGHGASDGEWDDTLATTDITTFVGATRKFGASSIVLCAAAESCEFALQTAGAVRIEGLILVSPVILGGAIPRGAGESKLFLVGAEDQESRGATTRLLNAAIGPALAVSVPGDGRGTALFTSEIAQTCREHIVTFLHRLETGGDQVPPLPAGSADRFLELLGIRPKGATT